MEKAEQETPLTKYQLIKYFSPVIVGFSMIELSILGISDSKGLPFVGYFIMLIGAYPLFIKEIIMDKYTYVLRTFSSITPQYIINIQVNNYMRDIYHQDLANRQNNSNILNNVELTDSPIIASNEITKADDIISINMLQHLYKFEYIKPIQEECPLTKIIIKWTVSNLNTYYNQTTVANILALFINHKNKGASINLKYKLFNLVRTQKETVDILISNFYIANNDKKEKIKIDSFKNEFSKALNSQAELLPLLLKNNRLNNKCLISEIKKHYYNIK